MNLSLEDDKKDEAKLKASFKASLKNSLSQKQGSIMSRMPENLGLNESIGAARRSKLDEVGTRVSEVEDRVQEVEMQTQ